jgi:N-acetylgalactosamine kinase
MTREVVPVFYNLNELYASSLHHAEEKFDTLYTAFLSRYESTPLFYVRAPGRVNLIGEHIDYEGYSVLPMALPCDIIIAVGRSPKSSMLHVSNISCEFEEAEYSLDPAVPIDSSHHHWSHYVLCGYKGFFDAESSACIPIVGIQLMVLGDIPAAAGLSSSSALVVAATLATAILHGHVGPRDPLTLTLSQLAEMAQASERYIGTISGGMDQTISCLGGAKLISFDPLVAETVEIPEQVVVIVANSLGVAEKALSATTHYNKRVVECMLASKLLGKALALPLWTKFSTLRQVQEALGVLEGRHPTLEEMGELVHRHLHEYPYTKFELEDGFFDGVSLRQVFQEESITKEALLRVIDDAEEYELNRRATHVYSEAARVLSFHRICLSHVLGEDHLAELGALMNQSHQSCSELYGCSSPELDELSSMCRQLGAIGSRLTGAGWGGSTVSLVRERDRVEFFEHLSKEFYTPERLASSALRYSDLSSILFSSKPCVGAAVIYLHAKK